MFTTVLIVITNLLVACAPREEKAPTLYRLPWLDASGNYTSQDIELKTFHEPDRFRGSVAEVVVDPHMTASSIEADEPIGRWVRDGSLMRPADFVTQQAATLYAHLEKLSEIDAATGVLAKMKGVSKVGLLVRISESISSPMILNNAVYDGRLDALLVVPYSGDLLPISQNAGIIGHEHFHRVFQSIVLSPIREVARNGGIPLENELPCMNGVFDKTAEKPAEKMAEKISEPREYPAESVSEIVPIKILNETLLRGVNEGFADFWGWAYSRDENFVARSLGQREDAARRLDKVSALLPQKAGFRNSLITVNRQGLPVIKGEGGRIAAAYRVGTEYARVLRGVVEALVSSGKFSHVEATGKVRLALAQSLGPLSSDVAATWALAEIEPELMMKPFFTALVKMSSSGPAVLEAASSAIVCDELVRLQASSQMLSGLCEAPAVIKHGAEK